MAPSTPPADLPDDPAFLKQVIVELRQEIEANHRFQQQLQHQPSSKNLFWVEIDVLGNIQYQDHNILIQGAEFSFFP